MRPIILFENETTESDEIYTASPNKICIIFIYVMLAFTAIAVIFMALFSIDEVTKVGGMIVKSNEQAYQTEIYISDLDYEKINVGQDVKIEILTDPAGEYAYCNGQVQDISRDPVIDPDSQATYYRVMVTCPSKDIKDENGNILSLTEGLSCRADIVTGKETLLHYFLKNM